MSADDYQRIVNRVKDAVGKHNCFIRKKVGYGVWYVAKDMQSKPFLEVAIAPNGTFTTRYLTPDAHRKFSLVKKSIIDAINSDERAIKR